MYNPDNVLYCFPPLVSTISQNYLLIAQARDWQLHDHLSRIMDNNFIIQMSYCNIYRHSM